MLASHNGGTCCTYAKVTIRRILLVTTTTTLFHNGRPRIHQKRTLTLKKKHPLDHSRRHIHPHIVRHDRINFLPNIQNQNHTSASPSQPAVFTRSMPITQTCTTVIAALTYLLSHSHVIMSAHPHAHTRRTAKTMLFASPPWSRPSSPPRFLYVYVASVRGIQASHLSSSPIKPRILTRTIVLR